MLPSFEWLLVQVWRQVRIRTGDAKVGCALVSHREKAPDAAGNGILCHRRVGVMPKFVEAGIAEPQTKVSCVTQVLGYVIVKNFESPLDARTGSNRGLGGSTKICIIEVHEPVCRGAHLTTLSQFFPRRDARDGAHEYEHCADRLAIADDNAMHAAHLTGLGGDVQSTRSANESHRGLIARADDFERRRSTGVRESTAGEKCSTPDCGKLFARSRCQAVRKSADGAPARIQKPRLPGKSLAAVHHTHEVVAGRSCAGCRDDRDFTAHAVELCEVFAHTTAENRAVQFGLNRDPVRDDVQSARESKYRREFCRTHCCLADTDSREFFFNVGGQGHCAILFISSKQLGRRRLFATKIPMLHAHDDTGLSAQ
jgi:hypothetical protein